MAQPAYNLDHFAPAHRAAPRRTAPGVRVAKRAQSARRQQMGKMLRTLLAVMVLVALVSGVLYTQATLTELQSQISALEAQLNEEKSYNYYLTFELDNMTSLKNIEERAQQLGLQRMDNDQIVYFRAEDGSGIEVKENPLNRLLGSIQNLFLSIVDYITP